VTKHSRHFSIAACLVVGALTGALASFAIRSAHHAEAASPSVSPDGANASELPAGGPVNPEVARPPVEASSAQLEEVRSRLAALEAAAARDGSASQPSTPQPEDRAASRLAVIAAHQAAIEAHLKNSPDPSWAPAANRAFEEDLRATGAMHGFEFRSVDCRMTSCTATVRFTDYATANDNFGALLHMRYQVNCASEVALDVPRDPNAPFETTVLYDCTEARSGQP
jgi:hypothetical protein